MHRFYSSEKYTELAGAVIAAHPDIAWIADADLEICFMGSDQEKKSKGRAVLGECIRVKDLYKEFCPYDFLIVLYDPNIERLTEEQLRILMYHELLHVGMDEGSGEPKYMVNPHDVEDFRVILERYGMDWAAAGSGEKAGR